MTKKLLKLLEDINKKKAEVRDLCDKGSLDEAEKAKSELVDMQKKFDLLKDVEDEEEKAMLDKIKNGTAIVLGGAGDAVHKFAEAARRGFTVDTDAGYPNEGNNNEGGYTVPEDIMTRINKFKEARFSLESLVDVESVSTKSGRRTYQTRAQHTGFTLTNEAGAIGQKAAPQFSVLEYAIKKYAGYLPVTNELLDDSDANITNTIVEWLGEEDIATRNSVILAAIATKTAEELTDLDGIKKAVNVDLGQAFAGSVGIVTNDDGFNYLDSLKVNSTSNEYLLKPAQDQTNPMKYTLAIGARVIPVTVVPNAILASATAGSGSSATVSYPFIIGDLKEAVKLFDRKQLSIMSSNVAAAGDFNAYEQDMTLFRGILRLDCKVKDASSFINGKITVSASANG